MNEQARLFLHRVGDMLGADSGLPGSSALILTIDESSQCIIR